MSIKAGFKRETKGKPMVFFGGGVPSSKKLGPELKLRVFNYRPTPFRRRVKRKRKREPWRTRRMRRRRLIS
jgi:hypothetical protein